MKGGQNGNYNKGCRFKDSSRECEARCQKASDFDQSPNGERRYITYICE